MTTNITTQKTTTLAWTTRDRIIDAVRIFRAHNGPVPLHIANISRRMSNNGEDYLLEDIEQAHRLAEARFYELGGYEEDGDHIEAAHELKSALEQARWELKGMG